MVQVYECQTSTYRVHCRCRAIDLKSATSKRGFSGGIPKRLVPLSGSSSSGREFRWAGPMAREATERHVSQLYAGLCASQHQPSAAHIATADELFREKKPIA